MILSVSDLNLSFGRHAVLQQFGFDLADGETACLLGSSGCGKTTALRCIAGFEHAQHGRIVLKGRELFSGSLNVPPHQRRIGMVFQDYALFPHLNVADNIAFGLNGHDAAARRSRVGELLELIGLPECGKRYPHQLSGGQQQRVALARALAPRPDLILLDEPFSSLDADLRTRLSQEVRALLKQENTSAVLVTHDQHEAFAMADRIGMMAQGRLQQWDSPQNLYHRPATPEVAAFVGQGAWLDGTLNGAGGTDTVLGSVSGSLKDSAAGNKVRVWVRPEQLRCQTDENGNAQVLACEFKGSHCFIRLQLDNGETLTAQTALPLSAGARVAVSWADRAECAVFAAEV